MLRKCAHGERIIRTGILTFLLTALTAAASAAESLPEMTLDQALDQLRTYDYGQSDKALRAIELQVVRSAADAAGKAQVAERLAAVLADPKLTQAAKVFICQQLLTIGTESQVPLLAKMLDDPQTAEIARYTLDAIGGEASLAALRGALSRLKGPPRIGVVNSLGLRRDVRSVGALSDLLAQADPELAAAAAEALGKIATAEAAAALQKAAVAPQAEIRLHNARLQCAERLTAAGDAATATRIYEAIWASDLPSARRLGGLVGLAKAAPEQAVPLVLSSLAAEDPLLRASAMQLAGRLPGQAMTAALVARLPQMEPEGRTLLLGVLAQRGDRGSAAAVVQQTEDENEAVRAAAVAALATLGDAAHLKRLVELAASGGGAVQAAAQSALARMTGADVEPALLKMAGGGDTASRAAVFRVLASRGAAAAAPVLLQAAAEPDAELRRAAFEALAAVTGPESYGPLVALLVSTATPGDTQAAERAVLEAGTRLATAQERLAPVLAALDKASDQGKPSLVRVLGGIGGVEALTAVRGQLAGSDETIRDAAVRALANWTDAAAASDLLTLAQTAESVAHRVLAMRGYLRLAGEVKDAAARLKMLEGIRPVATNQQSKRMLLATLAEAADPGALQVAAQFLGDAEVQAEAEVAVLKIARALVRVDPPGVRAAMRKVIDTTKDQQVAAVAESLDEEAMKAPPPDAAQTALQHDRARSDATKATLAKRAPQGYRLVCYLDCGPDRVDGAKGGPLLRLVGGSTYFWAGAEQLADVRFGSVFFDGSRVIFEASGLNPKKSYQLGFTWWDFDHATRAQSLILATAKGENEVKVLDKTRLPSGTAKQAPDEKTVAVPPELYRDGSLRISFRNEAQPNVVVSELWLWESDTDR
ncbi:MAG TPA: HEAT repeat domain-containing protein [Candidatus Anammoximicrobium sp.]|nr:HEAT repeat domain-containing protein [Candidatus Anammoximicrobium sp.]